MGWTHHSFFEITPTLDGRTNLVVEMNQDPKGLVPKFLVNLVQKSWPRDYFDNLRNYIRTKNFTKTQEAKN